MNEQPEASSRRAARRRTGRPRHPDRPCLNCGDATVGEFCPTCGQRKVDVQVSVRAMVADLLEDELLLNRRLPRTLGALLFRPGLLTAEVLDGRIVRYVRPFKLYLVSSVIFFLVLSFVGLRAIRNVDFESAVTVDGETIGDEDPERMLATIDSALAEMDAQLAGGTGAADPGLRATRGLLERQREALLARLDRVAGADSLAADGLDSVRPAGEDSVAPTGPDGVAAAAAPSDDQDTEGWIDPGNVDVNLGHSRLDSIARARIEHLASLESGRAAMLEVARTFLKYVPTAMFLLLPVFAAVLELLYLPQGRYYAEHMIFLLHTHAFVYAIFTLLLVGEWLSGWMEALLGWTWLAPFVATALLVWAFVYVYLAMKRVYGQGGFKTFLKYWTLGWSYFWVLTFSVPVLFVGTLLLLPA